MTAVSNELMPDPTLADLRSAIRQMHESSENHSIGLHRKLHDELGGLIVSAAMDLAALALHLRGLERYQKRLTRAHTSMIAAVDLNRRLSEAVRSSLLDNLGLFAALRWHIKEDCAYSPAVCADHFPAQEMKLTSAAKATLYRIGQESLELVFAEPDLKSVDFYICINHDTLEMNLAHDHAGDEPVDMFGNAPGAMFCLSERARSLGGRMVIRRSDVGTELLHSFPVGRLM